MAMNDDLKRNLIVAAAAAVLVAGLAVLLTTIIRHKVEAQRPFTLVAEVNEETTDPAPWGLNFPHQYDSFKRTVDVQRTRFGGSEAFSRLEADPRLKTIFNGYAFAIDFNEERGHHYTLSDQRETLRVTKKPQPGACLQCHASVMPAYRKAGDGDVMKGFEKVCAMPYAEATKLVDHAVSCVDCHDPKTMKLRVTRPAFLKGIKAYKASLGVKDYDPNRDASRQEMRSFACGQCHVEYYFAGGKDKQLLTYPWHKGLKAEDAEAYYDEVGHVDWVHADSGAGVLKAQHPEFELFNQGIHARSGVACADCHMPYERVGAAKVSDHHARSPMLNVRKACLTCHNFSEQEMVARVEAIQSKTRGLLDRSEEAVVELIQATARLKALGAAPEELKEIHALQRKAQWREDYINAENSMGFHAPQEAARLLAESVDYARQGPQKALVLEVQIKNGKGRVARVAKAS